MLFVWSTRHLERVVCSDNVTVSFGGSNSSHWFVSTFPRKELDGNTIRFSSALVMTSPNLSTPPLELSRSENIVCVFFGGS